MRALLLLAVLLAPTAALAQSEGGPQSAPRADFIALDRSGDGRLSKVEALGNQEIYKRFASFDANKDGHLSEAEFVLAVEDNQRRILRDSLITARVKAALLAERGIPSLQISVETYEGGVQLSGFVGQPDLVSRAGRVTASVSGVRTVHNNILVK